MNIRWVDVREYSEYAAGYIQESELIPLGKLDQACAAWDRSQPLMLVCRSGRRAEQARQTLAGKGFIDLTVLEGGVEVWRKAGKPLLTIERLPWAMERQVRASAGALILLFVILGHLASPLFFWGAALVGAGLLFAGISDICMMASLLRHMPWNKQARLQR